jgi:hypothetical protein
LDGTYLGETFVARPGQRAAAVLARNSAVLPAKHVSTRQREWVAVPVGKLAAIISPLAIRRRVIRVVRTVPTEAVVYLEHPVWILDACCMGLIPSWSRPLFQRPHPAGLRLLRRQHIQPTVLKSS